MRANAWMRSLVPDPTDPRRDEDLPRDLEDVLADGWREGPGGALLLSPAAGLLSRNRPVAPGDLGEYEYEHNDFAVPRDDLALAVEQFVPRLTPPGALHDDDQIDYRLRNGNYPEDIQGYLSSMTLRGMAFASRALVLAAEQNLPGADKLTAIVNTGVVGDVLVHGTHMRLTTARGVPSGHFSIHWFDDLDRFTMDAMAVLTMADAQLSSADAIYRAGSS